MNSLKNIVKIIVIDNTYLAKFADILVLPGAREQFRHHPANSLIGIDYVIINPNFKLKKLRRKKTLLLNFGASDKYDITTKFVNAIKNSNIDFKINVVVGDFNTNEDAIKNLIKNDKRFCFFRNPPNFDIMLQECAFAILSFGITIYEAALTKTPSFIVSHSEENHISAKALVKYGWYYYLGKYDKIDYDLTFKNISKIALDSKFLQNVNNSPFIDGKGAYRIANSILKLMKKT